VNNRIDISIDGFANLEDCGTKADGTPDIRCNRGYSIRVVENHARVLFEETLRRGDLPVDPTSYLANRLASILTAYLPGIDPGVE
jgi:hypothetical protein